MDNYSDVSYLHLKKSLIFEGKVQTKRSVEAYRQKIWVKIRHYHEYNGMFKNNSFMNSVKDDIHRISFCGFNSHFQNWKAENYEGLTRANVQTAPPHYVKVSNHHVTIHMTICTVVVQPYLQLLTIQVRWDNLYQYIHNITDSSQTQGEPRLQTPSLFPTEPPTCRRKDIKMKLYSKDRTVSGTITKACLFSFPDSWTWNGYGFAKITRPTWKIILDGATYIWKPFYPCSLITACCI